MYRLVMEDKKGLRIGRKQYNTKEEAEKRAKALAKIGINMRVMAEQRIFQ